MHSSFDEYVVVDSFECDGIIAGGGGTSCVAIGTAEKEIHIVESGDRTTLDMPSDVVDVTVGEGVHILTEDSLVTYSIDGSRLWSSHIPGPRRVVAIEGAVVVCTEGDELIYFDEDTGTELLSTSRPKSDIDFTPCLVANGDHLLVATWSFVTVLNRDGAVVDTHSCDGTIDALGVVEEVPVVSFSDGTVAGLDMATGEELWRRELLVRTLPDRSGGSMTVLTADGISSLSPDGSLERVGSIAAERLFVALGGDPLCLANDRTVSTYRKPEAAPAAISAELASRTLPNEGDGVLSLSLNNEADWHVDTTVRLTGEGVKIKPETVPLAIDPHGRLQLDLNVSRTSEDDAPTINVSCEGDNMLTETLRYRSRPVVEVRPSISGIRDGIAMLSITVKNDGQDSLSDLTVSPAGATIDTLHSGEERTVETRTAFHPGTDISVVVSNSAEKAIADAETAFPESPVSISAETTETGALGVQLSNTVKSPISDRLVVRGSPLRDSINRPIELGPNEEYVTTTRAVETSAPSGSIHISLPGVEASRRIDASALDLSSPVEIHRDRDGTVPVDGTRGEELPSSAASVGSDNRSGADDGSEPSSDYASIDARMELTSITPTVSELVTESVYIENTGDQRVEDVYYRQADTITTVGDFSPGEKVVLRRGHTLTEQVATTIEGGAVLVDTDSAAETEGQELAATTGDVSVEGTVVPQDGGQHLVSLSVRNDRDVRCTLERIEFHTGGAWDTTPVDVVNPGQTFERSATIEGPKLDSKAAVKVGVELSFDDEEDPVWHATLLPIDRSVEAELEELDLAVSYRTRFDRGEGRVILSITNTADEPLHDVKVKATDEDIRKTSYSGEFIDKMSSGERWEHPVEAATDEDDIELTFLLRGTTRGERHKEVVTVGGPTRAENGWHKSLLDEWEVRRAVEDTLGLSAHVTTTYRVTEPGDEPSGISPQDRPSDRSEAPEASEEPHGTVESEVASSAATSESQRTYERKVRSESPESDDRSVSSTNAGSASAGRDRNSLSGSGGRSSEESGNRPTCGNCGEAPPTGANYCPYCETNLSDDTSGTNSTTEPGPTEGGGDAERRVDTEAIDCDYCGKSIPPGANYCPYCEAKLSDRNPEADSKTVPDIKYCEYCGTGVDRHANRCPSCDGELQS